MPRTLKEFLAEQAETLKGEIQKAVAIRDEWVSSVGRLIDQVREWLDSSDPDKVLEVNRWSFERREEGIGSYMIDGLTIILGRRIVRVEPVARFVAGPQAFTGVVEMLDAKGRVDLTNGLQVFSLYRSSSGENEQWFIVDRDRWKIDRLDRETFEAAVQSLLQ
jgi:hypothetical protein